MARPRPNTPETYVLPKTYLPIITQLIREGQADVSMLSPKLRRAIGRTAQNSGLFQVKKVCLIQAETEIAIVYSNDHIIEIQKKEEPRLETL